ncbi:MAG: sugar MFS transporter [Bacteroidales bacterium]|nr:sugar MFS transporter [Bacteroidales bacterium]
MESSPRKTDIRSLVILAAMFFIFGFVSWVNSILIPYFRIACELTHFQSYFVTFAFYIAYFIMAIPSGKLLQAAGFKKGIMVGFMFMALGMFLFVPAALLRTFPLFLTGLFLIGTGLAILQTAANPYVTIIGPIDSAARRISIVGVCNKLAGILAPLVFAAVILKASDSETFALIESGALTGEAKAQVLDELVRRVIWPYTILGTGLLAFGIWIRYSFLPEIDPATENATPEGNQDRKSVFSYPYLVLGALAIFFHVGSQVIAIDTLIQYAGTMGLDMLEAKVFPSYTLTCTMLGYLIGIALIPKYLSQKNALVLCTLLGLVLSLCAVLVDVPLTFMGHRINASLLFLNALGLPNALIYAGIWPLAIRGLGRHTKLGSSLLIMGLCGNAIMPQIYGLIADNYSLRAGYWILIPCFIYLIWYALHGHKIEYWKK